MLLNWLCLIALLACAPLTRAQVYRCIGAHGEPVFSGQPCGAPAPPPVTGAAGSNFGGVCAASPEELRQSLAQAFSGHDVNRLAGFILWQGMDQASARVTLQSLAAWLQQPLTGIATAYATGPPLMASAPPPVAGPTGTASASAPPIGFEVATGDGATRDFGISEFGGCWWLTF
ncbi:MAG TPA: DUF4124 domain-containing protein [Rhodanobacteraceae bacterium]|nr:DUF4124 domain-containing protein [Rhodanobacteraceae bacterium]